MSEEILWKASPSQLLNLGKFLIALLLMAGIGIGGMYFPPIWAALVLPLGWILWVYLKVRCERFELTTERLRMYSGVFNQTIDEIELYRVKDTVMELPFWFRIFGLGTLKLDTSDRSHPKVSIHAIRDAVGVRETLRKQVEYWRDKKRVREVDFEEGGDMEGDDFGDMTD